MSEVILKMSPKPESDRTPLNYATPDLNSKERDAQEYFREPPDAGKIAAILLITVLLGAFLYLYFFRNWF